MLRKGEQNRVKATWSTHPIYIQLLAFASQCDFAAF